VVVRVAFDIAKSVVFLNVHPATEPNPSTIVFDMTEIESVD